MITKAQREERRQGLGGSDIAGIIPDPNSPTKFISPWTNECKVWDSKMNPADDKDEGSEAMYWGSMEEDLVARRFSELTGKRTVNHNFMIHDGCLLANLDRLIVPEGAKIAAHMGHIRTSELFEAKTAGHDWNPAEVIEILPNGYEVLDGEAGIPRHYITQCYHYMGRVPTAEKIYLAVKLAIPMGGFSRTDFRVYCLKRDDEIIRMQDEYARAWWDKHIIHGERPTPQSEEDCKIIYRRSTPATSITVDAAILDAWRQLKAAKAMASDAAEAESNAKAILKTAMGDNEAIIGPDGKTIFATWKSGKDKEIVSTDWEAVARSLNPSAEEIAAVEMTWESLAKAKGATEEQIKAATTTTVKSGNRTFLAKFTDKVVGYADTLALPAAEPAVNPAVTASVNETDRTTAEDGKAA